MGIPDRKAWGLLFLGILILCAWPRPLHPTQTQWAPLQPEHTRILPAFHLSAPLTGRSRRKGGAPPATNADRGRALFFDPGFSRDGTVSCATCHDPERAFASPRIVAARNAPSLLGVAHLRFLNWDGSADSLVAQAYGPLTHPEEMGYACVRNDACGPFLRHVAAYVETLFPTPTRFDVVAGQLASGASLETLEPTFEPREARGLSLFLGPARCAQCHHGPLFSDGEFHNIGVPVTSDESPERAAGRIEGLRKLRTNPYRCETCEEWLHAPFERKNALGAFKTPTLRELAKTPPYMHNGVYGSLAESVTHYARAPEPSIGASELDTPPLDPQALADIEAFLLTLSSRGGARKR